MGIQERLQAFPLEELEALAKKARVPRYDEREAMKARRLRGKLCTLSLKDLAALEDRALVDEDNEKKAYFIEWLISKGVPEHGPPASPLGQGEPPSGEFSGGDGVGSFGFEAPEAGPSAIPAEKVLLLLLLFLLFLLL